MNPAKKQARYYQREGIESLLWGPMGWETNPYQLIRIGTGGGKTFMAADTMRQTLPGRSLFLGDSDELVAQPRPVIREITGVITGIEKAKERASLNARIVVGSVQTLIKLDRLIRFPKNFFDYIYTDEIHRNTEAKIDICRHFPEARVCGLTATDWRSNMADLSKWFQNVAVDKPLIRLAEEGFAPIQRTLMIPVEIDFSKLRSHQTPDGNEFVAGDVESAIEPHYDQIADIVREHSKGYYGIAFLPLKRSSKAFAAALRKAGVSAYHIDGSSPDREAILEAFKKGEFSWLVNAGVMSTGVDIPICNAFLNLTLTKSMSQYQQRKGRAARVLPGVIDHLPEENQARERKALIAASGKPDFLVFDLLGNDSELGNIRPMDEYTSSREDSRALYERMRNERSPQDIAAMARKIQEERELKLVEALERAALRSNLSAPLSPLEIGAILGDRVITDYTPIQAWEVAAPTEAQLRTLGTKGVDLQSVKSKWQASRLIDVLSSRSRMGFATLKQVKLLKQINEGKSELDRIASPEKMSLGEAARTLKEEAKKRSSVALV